jgi:YidC/Oxa1 family membrane protein insertase
MPVFLALYVVFEQSVELRAQAFLWMKDLSAPDALFTWGFTIPIIGPSFNLLPILMAATNVIQMMIMKTPSTDEMQERIQKQMMIMMPIMLLIFLYQLPSGLILYWTVSNVISIGQSYMTKRIIQKHMDEHGTASPKVTIEKSAA